MAKTVDPEVWIVFCLPVGLEDIAKALKPAPHCQSMHLPLPSPMEVPELSLGPGIAMARQWNAHSLSPKEKTGPDMCLFFSEVECENFIFPLRSGPLLLLKFKKKIIDNLSQAVVEHHL